MSNRPTRNISRFDYKTYNRTGQKITKNTTRFDQIVERLNRDYIMDGNKLKEDEQKISLEIIRFWDEYKLEELFDIDDIKESIDELKNLVKNFENIHVELRITLGEEEYNEKYPNYKNDVKRMTEWIKIARKEISERKKKDQEALELSKNNEKLKEKEESTNATKMKNKSEVILLKVKIKQILTTYNFEKEEYVEDIERGLYILEEILEKYIDLHHKLEFLYDDLYQEEREEFHQNKNNLYDLKSGGQRRIKELKQLAKTLSEQKEKAEAKKKFDEKVTVSKHIFQEIESRYIILKKTCVVSLSILDDSQILEKKKNIEKIDKEFNVIMEKFTELVKEIPGKYDKEENVLNKVRKIKDDLMIVKATYQSELDKEISNRDLSAHKLQNASLLNIKLPRFKGYNSTLDIYTFQTEFEKLVSPNIQRKLLPDYLKMNYLDGSALLLVKETDDLEGIWAKLKEAFGCAMLLLQNKLSEVKKDGPLWKIKDKERLIPAISKLLNSMTELNNLAEKHSIKDQLYHHSYLALIFDIIGNDKKEKFTYQNIKVKLSCEEKWKKLMEFLTYELKVIEHLVLDEKSKEQPPKYEPRKGNRDKEKPIYTSHNANLTSNKCIFCDKDDHVSIITKGGKELIHYFSCEKFVTMKPAERFQVLKNKNLCFQCLYPGAKKNHEGNCYDQYACKHSSHKKFSKSKHVLVCEEHKEDEQNKELFEKYKSRFISNSRVEYKDFTKNMTLSFYADAYSGRSNEESKEISIFMLQTILVEGKEMNLFYDSGCFDLCCRKEAVDKLQKMNRANNEVPGPLTITGVGDNKSICQYGIYRLRLNLYNGKDINVSGMCLDKVTSEFPKYNLHEVQKDIIKEYEAKRIDSKNLPKLPKFVGGATDIMLGITYLKYFPKPVFELPSGLTIYKSEFANVDGSRGVIAGPHHVFNKVAKQLKGANMSLGSYCARIVKLYKDGYKVSLDMPLLGAKIHDDITVDDYDEINPVFLNKISGVKLQKKFEETEKAGADVSYRCLRCRNCSDCKNNDEIEHISIQEEVEQNLIDKSIIVNLEKCETIAKLPFIKNPTHRLSSNEDIAMKVYKSQIKKLENCQEDKNEVIKSELKLQTLGYVEFVDKLPEEEKLKIVNSPIKYFIPWRVAWNPNSVSTFCRLVFDASMKTTNRYSLNDLLAKGRNNMNKLVEIVIRWRIHKFAYHSDIQKMYNTIKLNKEHWCYQLYLWENNLNPTEKPEWKVIKTLIYGIKSSGNQAERGLRQTAELQKATYPHENEVIRNDIYVDDCLSGENSLNQVYETTDNIKLLLNKGGFNLKGITYSGSDPPEYLSEDGSSVKVAGMIWYSKLDQISLNIKELNFAKKKRGRKSTLTLGVVPEELTRRDCVGKVAEVFDLIGRVTPITAGMKMDLRDLTRRKLDWDDKIPDDLRGVWKTNFEMIKEMANIRFNRLIVPEDAEDLNVETIDVADASCSLICAAIYGRFKRKHGEYSCQLMFSRSNLVPDNITMPRAELLAAVLNSRTGHIVKRSLGKNFSECIKLTDSQIVLHWIHNTKLTLKQWVRNRVIEINRLDNSKKWMYINSSNMVADIGTRKGARIQDISENGVWVVGHPWMKLEKEEFPVKSIKDLRLSSKEKDQHDEESLQIESPENTNHNIYSTQNVPSEVEERYRFNNYVIDPNKFRLQKVIRILAIVILFIKNLKKKVGRLMNNSNSISCIPSLFTSENNQYLVTEGKSNCQSGSIFQCKGGLVVILTNDDLKQSLTYFYRKATEEVKQFLDQRIYQKISKEMNGILYYTGRILSSQKFHGKLTLSDVSLDLTSASFCVPITDNKSPFAYSVVNETHWYNDDAKHSGVETVLRYTRKIAYIIKGRELVKSFRKDCTRCRILAKRALEVAMGLVHDNNLNIAPAFFMTQVDIFGPMNSYSNVNKRATVKMWFVVFCCCSTGAIDVKTMEDYTTESFILAFTRFACKVGYPKKLMPDEGSQLVKGCKTMKLEYFDIKHKLHKEYGIEFETCPPGAHYMHGKVERKIKHVQDSFLKVTYNSRLSILQWETLGDQVANSVNNQPIAIGNIVEEVENLDILTPNRLILGRNNERSPTGNFDVTSDPRKIIQANSNIFKAWFECWLISYIPTLIEQPKWFNSDRDIKLGDVILFLKSSKEFEKQYQYGLVKSVKVGKDNKIRKIEVEYQNHEESVKRYAVRGTRDIVVIHPADEIGISFELGAIARSSGYCNIHEVQQTVK